MVIDKNFKEYYKNHTTKEAADYYGVSSSTIIRTAKSLGCSKPIKHGYKKGEKPLKSQLLDQGIKKEIYSRYMSGEMVNFLKKDYGLSWVQVSQVLLEFGIVNPARRLSDLSDDIKEKWLEERRQSHFEKTGSRIFSISEEQKRKISETRRKRSAEGAYGNIYSEAQKKLIKEGHRPFGGKQALKQSKVNERIFRALSEKGLICEREKQVGLYFYDFAYKTFLIEINPTVTHNVTMDYSERVTGKKPKTKKIYKKYHYDRWKNAQEHGYELISWFGWMDLNRFIDFLVKRLEGFGKRIFARNTQLKEISKVSASEFLNENHLLGANRGNEVNLGLFDGEQLVQVMTFGKPRNTDKAQFELMRLASISNLQVVGGASKLLNYFIKTYNPSSILTYADNNLGSHRVYEKIGFTLLADDSISATWDKPETRKKRKLAQGSANRITESSLVKLGADRFFKDTPGYFKVGLNRGDFIDRGGLAEYEKEYTQHADDPTWWPGNNDIMVHMGFYKVYDCGYSTYLWKK